MGKKFTSTVYGTEIVFTVYNEDSKGNKTLLAGDRFNFLNSEEAQACENMLHEVARFSKLEIVY